MTRPEPIVQSEPEDEELLKDAVAALKRGVSAGNPLAPDLERMIVGYRKLLRCFNKTVSISDRYQQQLMDLKERLEVAANTDLLTGLASRWKIMEQLSAEQSRAERHGGTFSILIADLDHFKAVNDTFGHQAGDRVLREIAGRLPAELRAEDFCGRWGGEEFLIILPETGRQQACTVAEKLVGAVRECSIAWEQRRLSVTISVGIGSYRRGMGLDGCIKLADDALYLAKRQGRDRFCAAEG